jgi:hypothetical protein
MFKEPTQTTGSQTVKRAQSEMSTLCETDEIVMFLATRVVACL